MKKNTFAFTLVELIVVITILAILGTIAFISLQGYSQNAKNAKVAQDLNTLASIIEIALTEGQITEFNTLITGDRSSINWVSTSNIVTLYKEDNSTETWTLDGVSVKYFVGNFNFPALRQNGADFKDSDDNDYVAAIAYSWSTAYYQLAWQQKEKWWTYHAVIKWNYIPTSSTSISLISARGSQTAISDKTNLWIQADNTNLY